MIFQIGIGIGIAISTLLIGVMPWKLMKNTSSTVSILIAIGDRKATIAIAMGDLFSNGDRDRDRDLKFDQDRDRNRNFRDRGHALDLTKVNRPGYNICMSQHDELELTSKKFPTETDMVFGSYCHVVSPSNLKKIRFHSPCEKNHKTSLSKVKSLNGQKIFWAKK